MRIIVIYDKAFLTLKQGAERIKTNKNFDRMKFINLMAIYHSNFLCT
jgi:hypothetical protein